MTCADDKNPTVLLLALGPLFACATSVFTALIIISVLLVCTLCATTAKSVATQPSPLPFIITTAISAIIVAALLIVLITLGFSDIVAAFAPQIILAAFSAAVLGTFKKPMPSAVTSSTQITVVGFLCELLGRGTLLGDYELAFAGATHEWLLRVVHFAPLPWLATPAGALLGAAGVTVGVSLWRTRTATHNDASAVITEPRGGRRVRVTGHIS